MDKKIYKVEEVKAHTKLIKKLVKANSKFSGNEDLLEDFCSETYQKSFLILQATADITSLEGYMKKVVSSAIMDVLKKNGRLGVKTSKPTSVKLVERPKAKVITKKENIEDSTNNSFEIDASTDIKNNGNIEQIEDIKIDRFEDEIIIEQENSFENEINIDENIIQEEQPTTLKGTCEYNKAPLLVQDLLYVADPRENIEEQIISKDIIENIINLVKKIDTENPQEMFFVLFKERYFLKKKQKEIANDIGISQSEVSKRLVQLSRLIKEKLY